MSVDARILNHQKFDLISCKLCNRIYHDPRLLGCLHSFCKACLDTYVAESGAQLTCPLCQELTPLASDGVDGLMKNTLLDRFIAQAMTEKTIVVAGKEVREMEKMLPPYQDTENPETPDSPHDNGAHVERVYDLDEEAEESTGTTDPRQPVEMERTFAQAEHRLGMQTQMTTLQEKALDVVYAIDQVNRGFEEWVDSKEALKHRIRERSQLLQSVVKSVERKLINDVDDRGMENEMKAEVTDVKGQLHKTLKGILTAVDFLKLLIEFGNKADVGCYESVVEGRASNLLLKEIDISHKECSISVPQDPLEDQIEELFGTLNEYSGTKSVWESRRSDLNRSSMTTSMTSGSLHVSPGTGEHRGSIEQKVDTFLMPRFTSVQGSTIGEEAESEEAESTPNIQRRRPLKSMSFDGTNGSIVPVDNSGFLHQDPEDRDETSTGIQQGTGASHQATGPRKHLRRVSAPSSSCIMSALAKRKMNALSILERSNIDTNLYRRHDDVGTGMNEARLLWTRENLRRKATGWHNQKSLPEQT